MEGILVGKIITTNKQSYNIYRDKEGCYTIFINNKQFTVVNIDNFNNIISNESNGLTQIESMFVNSTNMDIVSHA
jgi:hypothetical protein